jgi:hypothetical protein
MSALENSSKKEAIFPESPIDSARRRDFIKKAAITTAALGLGGTALRNNLLPKVSAKSDCTCCHCNMFQIFGSLCEKSYGTCFKCGKLSYSSAILSTNIISCPDSSAVLGYAQYKTSNFGTICCCHHNYYPNAHPHTPTGDAGFAWCGFGSSGWSNLGAGVVGATEGLTPSPPGKVGTYGLAKTGTGVLGQSACGPGVRGVSSGNTGCSNGVVGLSCSTSASGVYGKGKSYGVAGCSSAGYGVFGSSASGFGVYGCSPCNNGVYGRSTNHAGVHGQSTNNDGVHGCSSCSVGVLGTGKTYGVQGCSASGCAVYGVSKCGIGVAGISKARSGVYGKSTSKYGVYGCSPCNVGVYGKSKNYGVFGCTTADCSSGVYGASTCGIGVQGVSPNRPGVYGKSSNKYGVRGCSCCNVGVFGKGPLYGVQGCSAGGIGVYGNTDTKIGVLGTAKCAVGVWAEATSQRALPLYVQGVSCGGDLQQWATGCTISSVVNNNGWLGVGRPCAPTTLAVKGSVSANVVSPSGAYTMSKSDYAVFAKGDVTLPPAGTAAGMLVFIKNIGTSAITLSPVSGDMIDGKTSEHLSKQYDSFTLISDGSTPGNWYIQSNAK